MTRSAHAAPTGVSATNLGPGVSSLSFNNGVLIGRLLWLGSARMQPARVVAYDFDAGRVTSTVDLPDVAGVWGMDHIGTDLYVATYTPGRLVRIDTVTGTVTDSIDLHVDVSWNVKASPDGKVFCGTYPRAELWEYDPATRRATNHGTMMAGETYVRDLAASETTVYCGIGSHPGLIAFDRATGTKTDIMPKEFADLSFVAVLNLSGKHLLAGTTPLARVAMINTEDPSDYTIATVPNDEPFVVGLYGRDDDVWVGTTKSNTIWHTTIGSTAIEPVTAGVTGTMRMGTLDEDHLWTVQSGGASVLDLTTNELTPLDLLSEQLQPAPQKPMCLHWADGRVFVPGTGVMAIHGDRGGGSVRTITTVGEVKDLDSADGELFGGLYTLALVGRMPSSDDTMSIVGRVAKEYEQTRPLDIAVDTDANRLLVGTEPDYGKWEGAFSSVDLATNEVTTWRGILPDQSVSAVCPGPGGAFLAGSIRNGYGTSPTRTTSQVGFFDYRRRALTRLEEPFAGTYSYVDLRTHGTMLLGLTNAGMLHALDTRTLRPIWSVKVAPAGGRTTRLGSRIIGTDGNLVWAVRLVGRRTPQVEVLYRGLAGQWYGLPEITSDGRSALFTMKGLDLLRLDLAGA